LCVCPSKWSKNELLFEITHSARYDIYPKSLTREAIKVSVCLLGVFMCGWLSFAFVSDEIYVSSMYVCTSRLPLALALAGDFSHEPAH
jgi:hypothetical protein